MSEHGHDDATTGTRTAADGPRTSDPRTSTEGLRRVGLERHGIDERRSWPRPPRAPRNCCPGRRPPAGELRQEVGAVLRLPEGNFINPADIDIERRDDETMIINMGPQHPSTHGVLRLMLELDGETVLRTKPIIGYLHTGMEKTAEELTYVQGATNVTRMDYLSPAHTTSWCSRWPPRRCSASSSRRGRSGSACSWPSSTGCRRTSCGWPPTAWTSAPRP